MIKIALKPCNTLNIVTYYHNFEFDVQGESLYFISRTLRNSYLALILNDFNLG